MLQNTVPVIMQTSSSEKPQCIGPMSTRSRPFLLFLSQARFLAACQKPKKHSTVINYTIQLPKKQHLFMQQD